MNRDLLVEVVMSIEPLLGELVFTGGLVADVYHTAPLTGTIRATKDADVICEVSSYLEYAELSRRIASLGYEQPLDQQLPPYRWVQGHLLLDVMPTTGDILGFHNRWYAQGFAASVSVSLGSEVPSIKVMPPPYFLASKFEAYQGRGEGDPYSSQDLEDIIAIIANRSAIVEEVHSSDLDVEEWISNQVNTVFHASERSGYVEALLPSTAPPDLRDLVGERLRALAGSAGGMK